MHKNGNRKHMYGTMRSALPCLLLLLMSQRVSFFLKRNPVSEEKNTGHIAKPKAERKKREEKNTGFPCMYCMWVVSFVGCCYHVWAGGLVRSTEGVGER